MKIKVNEESYLLEYLINNTDKSRKDLKVYLKYGNIKVNNRVVTKFDKLLKKDDVIDISESKNKNKDLVIIYEDKDIIVIDKPYGMLSIASESDNLNTAYKLVMEYLKGINKNNKVFVVHRLDKDTSGVLLLAKNEITKNFLQANWENIVTRKYIGIVEGKVEKEKDVIESLLNENDEHYVYSDKTGKRAKTEYKRLKYNDKYSLLDIKIYTGRKNQIRVHMKDINHII
ncbi:MAG: RluA family pseudouridine synthase [Bacilli bacterium]|nr:RluA family pseudouridine synthase [Bacilli bacterium]